jgi:hypothetical protein
MLSLPVHPEYGICIVLQNTGTASTQDAAKLTFEIILGLPQIIQQEKNA